MGELGVLRMGEHGVLRMGEHGVLRMGENGVLRIGEHGVFRIGEHGVSYQHQELKRIRYQNMEYSIRTRIILPVGTRPS